MRLFKMQVLLTVGAFWATEPARANWVTFDYPQSSWAIACDVDGDNIVGRRITHSGPPLYNTSDRGFLYNGYTWETFGRSNGIVEPESIDGAKIVGSHGVPKYFGPDAPRDYVGFIYETNFWGSGSWTTFEFPEAEDTWAKDIDVENIVGYYTDASETAHAFLYDGTSWTSLDFPGASSTYASGIDGDNIVGSYKDDSDNTHAFFYDGITWTSLDFPGAVYTNADGIHGDNIVGHYRDASLNDHGFLYDGTSWIQLDFPDASSTGAKGIDGDRIVGYYWDGSTTHGFIYTIPEPATILLLGLGVSVLRKRRRA
ncbi:MAG: PEP-CTERM sorting domain-containing protein [Planctomycetota bacterium]